MTTSLTRRQLLITLDNTGPLKKLYNERFGEPATLLLLKLNRVKSDDSVTNKLDFTVTLIHEFGVPGTGKVTLRR